MAIHSTCPQCQSASQVPDEYLGRKVQCQRCKQIYQVDAPEAEILATEVPAPPRATPSGTRRAVSSKRRVPVRRSEKERRNSAAMAWVIGIVVAFFVLLILGGTIAGAWWAMNNVFKEEAKAAPRPNVPQATAPRNPGFPPGMFNPEEEEGDNQSPPFEVKDMTNADAGFVDLHPRIPFPKTEDTGSAPSGESGLADEIRVRIKTATPRLFVTQDNGQQGEGSGFFVAPGIVITNRHVVGMLDPSRGKPRKIDIILDGGEKSERTVTGEVLAIHPHADLAVVQVKGANLPTPLTVGAARSLHETQRIYTVGYPMGSERTKNVSIREASVNALMKDSNGDIRMLGVEGGMYHGNSGGPVVDLRGKVIGVSVSGFADSNGRLGLNNAVPAEFVHELISGYVERLSLEYPIRQGEGIAVPYTIKVIDPLKRLTKMDLEWWLGDTGDERAASLSPPANAAGDAPRSKLSLTMAGNTARGTLQIPAPPAGKVLWLQMVSATEKGEKQWSSAVSYAPPPPLVSKKVAVTIKPAGSAPETVQLAWKAELFAPLHTEREVHMDMGAKIAETASAAGANGVSRDYKEFDVGVRLQDHSARGLTLLRILQDLFGNTEYAGQSNVQSLTPRARNRALIAAPWLNKLIDALEIPATQATDQPWKAERHLPVGKLASNTEPEKAITITFRPLGVRQQNGQEEAAIALDGRSSDGQGTLRGLAWVDLASGRVVLIRAQYEFHLVHSEGPRDKSRAGGVMDVRIQRTLAKSRESS